MQISKFIKPAVVTLTIIVFVFLAFFGEHVVVDAILQHQAESNAAEQMAIATATAQAAAIKASQTPILPTPIVTPTPVPEVTPSPTPIPLVPNVNTFGLGHWSGQGQYDDGRPPFSMDLYITWADSSAFSGYLHEGKNVVSIYGTQSGHTFKFHSKCREKGDPGGIILGCVYSGIISGGQIIDATWDCSPANIDLIGTFNLGFDG